MIEFPEMNNRDVRQAIYDEFGFRDNSFEVQLITIWARDHLENK